MKYMLALILLFMTLPAQADEFGARFGNEPPFALRDTLDPSTVIYIEPAAGAEEDAGSAIGESQEGADQGGKIKGRVYPSEGPSIEVRSSTN